MAQTITVQRLSTTGTKDEYNNPVESWSNHLYNIPARVYIGGASENRSNQDTHMYDAVALVDPDYDIIEQDRFSWNGVTYDVETVEPITYYKGIHHQRVRGFVAD